MGEISYSAWIERGAYALGIQINYYVPGYNDPETGEYFGETEWNLVITELGGGTGGMSGYGWESDSPYIDFGLPGDQLLHTFTLDFTARNRFSADEVSQRMMVYSAAYATVAQVITADHNPSIIIGGEADDVLTGGDGNDVIDGGRGNNTLSGGAGADQLTAIGGVNTLIGGEGDDVYTIIAGRNTIVEQGDDGYDSVFSYVSLRLGDNVERLALVGGGELDGWGNAVGNRIDGNFYANRLWGLAGDDAIYAGAGDDILYGGDGNDILYGEAGADRMVGGAGDDEYGVDSVDDVIVERAGEGVDTVTVFALPTYTLAANIENMKIFAFYDGDFHGIGNGSANRIAGSNGDDLLEGLGGDDELSGGAGDDLLVGGRGADVLIGGAGSNTASYAGSAGAVRINLALNLVRGGDAAGDVLTDIQNLIGTDGDDRLTGDSGANVLAGGAGLDLLIGGGGDDTLIGGAGADVLAGGAGRNTLSYAGSAEAVIVDLGAGTASGGDATGDVFTDMQSAAGGFAADTLTGDARANRLFGDAGDDLLDGGAGDDVIEGGAGADTLFGGLGTDALSYAGSTVAVTVDLAAGTASGGDAEGDAYTGFEDVIGSALADRLIGDAGRNTIDGGDGHDFIRGGGGNDVIRGGAGGDFLDGGSGRDTLSYEGSLSWVYASLQDGSVMGGDAWGDVMIGFENLTGSEVGDALYGNADANVIRGGGGNDTIGGYGGDDVLFGGEGADVFVVLPDPGHVTIMDFDPSGGGESMEIVLGAAFDTYLEVMGVAETMGDDVLFRFSEDVTVLVKGVTVESFAVDAFVFG